MMKIPDDWFARIAFSAMADISAAERGVTLREEYRPDRDDALFRRARANEIAPHVAHALGDHLDVAPTRWRDEHAATAARIGAYMDELDRVADVLARESIRLVGLKNAGIARGIFPCLGCSPMGDLDVLVSKKDFRRAHRILIDDGYQVEFRSPLEEATLEAGERGGGMEYFRDLPGAGKLWFELQWRPVAGRWIRPDQEPPGDELLARSIAIPGTKVRLLAPLDNLLQVALHTAKHSYVRAPGLRLHTDVDRIVRRQTIDWEAFVAAVEQLQVKTAVYFSLAIPALALGTPVPRAVLHRLRPSRFRARRLAAGLERAGLFEPHERKFTNAQFVWFTALLYDSLGGLWRAVFPDSRWMQEHYGVRSRLALPAYHVRRLGGLLMRRTL